MHPLFQLVLAQIPDSVTQTGTDLFKQGGFAAVAAVLGATAIASGWLFLRERAANKELTESNKELAIELTRIMAKLEPSMAAETMALNAMSVELRRLGDTVHDLERKP